MAEDQRAAVLLSWQAVQRKPVGRLQWSTANRSSSAWPPRQARNVSPIGCSFCRSRRPSTGSILWLLPASSTSPTSTKPELKTWFPIGSRLPELHMASRTDASPFWHVSCSVPARPIIGMDGYGIEWNKQDHTLRAVIPGDPALHADVRITRHSGGLRHVHRAPPGQVRRGHSDWRHCSVVQHENACLARKQP